ncbi:MAG TPA: hypothetical protein VHZ25_02210 [Acidobacteriaceae bacterium]|jgi:hypothetical protein|nr:hypothetical protein [Acidobacteriaceae bacterium]
MLTNAPIARTSRLCTMMLAAVAFASVTTYAQQDTTAPAVQQSPRMASGDASGFGTNPGPHDPEQARMLKDMGRERNTMRQKQIVDDTEHLLDLAQQLKDAVDKSSKDQLSLSVVNTANEIEKLAKTVKEKMRDGQ